MKKIINRKNQGAFTLIELMIVVAIIGILAVLAVYGVSKYIANAKTAEARNSLGQLSKDAAAAYERESMKADVLAPGAGAGVSRRLCVGATKSVPDNIAKVKGQKYQSTKAEWSVDSAANAGFACLRFQMDQPQYYVYNYTAVPAAEGADQTGTTFTASAEGDLDGNTVASRFEVLGTVNADGRLYVAPNMKETAPEE